jgi:hypothetical protein
VSEPDLRLVPRSKALPGASWNDDQFSVMHAGKAVGGIAREGMSGGDERWWWEITTQDAQRAQPAVQIKGPAADREAAMTAFRAAWNALQLWSRGGRPP